MTQINAFMSFNSAKTLDILFTKLCINAPLVSDHDNITRPSEYTFWSNNKHIAWPWRRREARKTPDSVCKTVKKSHSTSHTMPLQTSQLFYCWYVSNSQLNWAWKKPTLITRTAWDDKRFSARFFHSLFTHLTWMASLKNIMNEQLAPAPLTIH